MTVTNVTTPFGRRAASLGQIAAQINAQRLTEEAAQPGSNHPAAVNKWKLFRTLSEIRERLGVSDRALSVLNALLSFHQETALTLPPPPAGEDDAPSCELVVFPSNRALCLRAHGMSEVTLRRHIAQLVAAGIIIRRDSPNGKRYARRRDDGTADGGANAQAFGFDLTPLVARAPEFEALAEELNLARKARQLLKERISLHRRDLSKLIALGLDDGLEGDWDAFRRRYMALLTPVRSLRGDAALQAMESALAALRRDVAKTLETIIDVHNSIGNDSSNDRHQSNSNYKKHSNIEPASQEARGDGVAHAEATPSDLPLGMVMEACPDLRDHAPSGQVRNWSDFLAAARAVRPMIGISPDAWRDAVEAMGETGGAIAVAAILQRGEYSSEAVASPGPHPGDTIVTVNGSPAIRSAGGYLRALTVKARAGDFAPGPLLMALIGQRLKANRGAAAAQRPRGGD
jgi:replication initiation protein RepC